MIPSYFKIEILAIRDEFVTQGHKVLVKCRSFLQVTGVCSVLCISWNFPYIYMFIWEIEIIELLRNDFKIDVKCLQFILYPNW